MKGWVHLVQSGVELTTCGTAVKCSDRHRTSDWYNNSRKFYIKYISNNYYFKVIYNCRIALLFLAVSASETTFNPLIRHFVAKVTNINFRYKFSVRISFKIGRLQYIQPPLKGLNSSFWIFYNEDIVIFLWCRYTQILFR